MKDITFHRPLKPLTPWEESTLIALEQSVRDLLVVGCGCMRGHTAPCRIQKQYRDSVEQTINEATELRMTWEDSSTWYGVHINHDLQANIPKKFSPNNPGWRVLVKL